MEKLSKRQFASVKSWLKGFILCCFFGHFDVKSKFLGIIEKFS